MQVAGVVGFTAGLAGTRYSFREHLDYGYAVWAFKGVRRGEVPPNATEGTPCPQPAGTSA